jgi:predicted transcriptional regulator of viral defense system
MTFYVMLEERQVFVDLPERLISEGRYTATTQEIAQITGRSVDAVRHGLARLRKQGRVFSPARGFHVFVPSEFRSWRVVPATWFIDELMAFMERDYYVALLSAARLHGASHQAPQTLQVITDRELDDRDLERVRLRFYQSAHVPVTPTIRQNSHTGTFKVSTPEATVIDLVERPRQAGGLSNIATILRELGELDGSELARLSSLRPRAHARRLGWLLERFRDDVEVDELRRLAKPASGKPTPLAAAWRSTGELDRGWDVLVNARVEPDV